MNEAKSCFVISPIGEPGTETRKRADQVLRHIIRPAVQQCGYIAKRADEIGQPGIITSQVIQRVIDDDLVVADLTEGNPNVFYELAVRHTIKKPVIQIIKMDETIPFDVNDVRTVKFDLQDPDSNEQAKEEIVNQIKYLENNSDNLLTPVSISVDLKELSRSKGLEKHFPMLIDIIGKSLRDYGQSTQDLVKSTLELNKDTRKLLRSIDARPRGLLTRSQEGLQPIQHNIQDED